MARKYYTLISRTPGELFAPEFGDYDREVVKQEMGDQMDSGGFVPGTIFKIISSGDSQAQITARIDEVNETIRIKALTEKK